MNSLKKDEGVPLLNFEGGLEVLLLNFRGVSRVPILNFEGGSGSQGPEVLGPRVLVPLLYHALNINLESDMS